MLDRFKPPTHEDFRELPICDCCSDECCLGLEESIRVEDDDLWFCSVNCLVKYDESFAVEALGGTYV